MTRAKLILADVLPWLLITVLSLSPAETAGAEVSPGTPGVGRDSWYYDMRGHWAEEYLVTLWREGVTNGYPFMTYEPESGWSWGYRFRPDLTITRGQLVLVMSKVFRLTPVYDVPSGWPDLPPSYRLYGIPVYARINAAARQWPVAPEGEPLGLAGETSRADAVQLVMITLNLSNYAQNLTRGEANRVLSSYRDAHLVRPSQIKTMAAAVKLGILLGYEDNTLRLERHLTRAEAITILYRCCLMRVQGDTDILSPLDDAHPEKLTVQARGLRNGNNRTWSVYVTDEDNRVITYLPSSTPQTGDPHDVHWDSRDHEGQVVPAGCYYISGWVTDRHSHTFEAVPFPVRVVHHRLRVSVEPDHLPPGGQFTITARTRGGATQVYAVLPGGQKSRAVQEGNDQDWTVWKIRKRALRKDGFSPGAVDIPVTAIFDRTSRLCTVEINVREEAAGKPVSRDALLPVLVR